MNKRKMNKNEEKKKIRKKQCKNRKIFDFRPKTGLFM